MGTGDAPERADRCARLPRREREQRRRHRARAGARHIVRLATMRPRFADVPQRAAPPGCSAAELTRHSIDKSYALQLMLERTYNNGRLMLSTMRVAFCSHTCIFVSSIDTTQLLGELQFSYLVFLVGQSFAGFEQWKRFVILLCQCETAIAKHPSLFENFVGKFVF